MYDPRVRDAASNSVILPGALGVLGFCSLIAAVILGGLGLGAQEESAPPDSDAPDGVEAVEVDEDRPVALVGKIDEDISTVTSAFVKRLITVAEEQGAAAVILDLNTFGGRVDAAVTIRDALIDTEIPTVAYIHRRAISAGALISLACDTIAISPGGTIGAATPIYSAPGQEMPAPVEEKYLSYFRQEMRSTAETHGRDGDVAEAMVDADKEIPGVTEEGKLLTLNTTSALELGIADFEAVDLDAVLEELELSVDGEPLARTWSEALVGFLTSPAIASLLFMAMMVFAYMEYQTPGFGAFGFLALVCLAILFGSHYMVNLAGYETLLLFALGVGLLMLEIFVIPGFGVAGVLGLVALFLGAVLMIMAGDWSDISITNPFTLDAVQRVLLSLVLGFALLLVMLRFLPRPGSGGAGRLVLGTTLASAAGYTSHEVAGAEAVPLPATHPEEATGSAEEAYPAVGSEGVAVTPLRPAGRARFGEQRLPVETEGGFLETGTPVKVLARREGRLVVRRA